MFKAAHAATQDAGLPKATRIMRSAPSWNVPRGMPTDAGTESHEKGTRGITVIQVCAA